MFPAMSILVVFFCRTDPWEQGEGKQHILDRGTSIKELYKCMGYIHDICAYNMSILIYHVYLLILLLVSMLYTMLVSHDLITIYLSYILLFWHHCC